MSSMIMTLPVAYLLFHISITFAGDIVPTTRPTTDVLPAGLSVRVIAEGETVQGDPVPLLVRVDNRGVEAITIVVPQTSPPDETTVLLGVKGPSASDFRPVKFPGIYCGALKGRLGPERLPIFTIQANHSQSFRLILGWDFNPANEKDRRWLFPTTGDYSVQVTMLVLARPAPGTTVALTTPPLRVQATPALVRVIEPATKADVLAAADLQRLRNGWMLYAPNCTGNALPNDLHDFRKHHADSRYFPFTELTVIHSDFWAAVVAKNRGGALRAYDRAREAAERAEKFAWPVGWKAEADRLFAIMSKEVMSMPS